MLDNGIIRLIESVCPGPKVPLSGAYCIYELDKFEICFYWLIYWSNFIDFQLVSIENKSMQHKLKQEILI